MPHSCRVTHSPHSPHSPPRRREHYGIIVFGFCGTNRPTLVIYPTRSINAHAAGPPVPALGSSFSFSLSKTSGSNGSPPAPVSLAAGAAAGALAKTTIAPFDRTKINFQVSCARMSHGRVIVRRSQPYSWRAALDFARGSVAEAGWRSLWRGNSATMARIVPYSSVQFFAHERWKRVLGVSAPGSAKTHPVRHLAAGALAGATSQGATYPLDVARARLAVSGRPGVGLGAVLTAMWAEGRTRALYRGLTPTLAGIAPYAGVSFATYEWLKAMFGAKRSKAMNLVWGGAAGALGQSTSYPLDVLRRRMQVAAAHTPEARSLTAVAARVWREEGWRGFYKGLSMNWIKGPIAVGVSFATYDAIKLRLWRLSTTSPAPTPH
ncbi:Mitochondrial coenzyme A transporter SLC25A42 [Eumeta japonica]|uniref:Mitochondrial coenzyme A transporter SLC25A42 n=1 Tax=Eumeta variegata TaxID=151549 RepID=A0A4C2AIF8_EUMVA|nr:Mitochondrial coenzyme A transporter SLC25A42 [Eumeta japonica]